MYGYKSKEENEKDPNYKTFELKKLQTAKQVV